MTDSPIVSGREAARTSPARVAVCTPRHLNPPMVATPSTKPARTAWVSNDEVAAAIRAVRGNDQARAQYLLWWLTINRFHAPIDSKAWKVYGHAYRAEVGEVVQPYDVETVRLITRDDDLAEAYAKGDRAHLTNVHSALYFAIAGLNPALPERKWPKKLRAKIERMILAEVLGPDYKRERTRLTFIEARPIGRELATDEVVLDEFVAPAGSDDGGGGEIDVDLLATMFEQAGLSRDDRDLLLWTIDHGVELKEAAQHFGWSHEATKKRAQRARKKLQAAQGINFFKAIDYLHARIPNAWERFNSVGFGTRKQYRDMRLRGYWSDDNKRAG